MITFEEFIVKWAGRGIDTDNAYGFQCMDLMHQYALECLGLPYSVLRAPAAKFVYLNFANMNGNQFFTKIPNTPSGVPNKGDIVLWDGLYGHVGIYRNGNLYNFNSFDQNYPVGSLSHVQYHTYQNVLGWLRFKEAPSIPLTDRGALLEIRGHYGSSSLDADKLFKINETLRKVGV